MIYIYIYIYILRPKCALSHISGYGWIQGLLVLHNKYWKLIFLLLEIYHISTCLTLRKYIDYTMIISLSFNQGRINQILKSITFLYATFLEWI